MANIEALLVRIALPVIGSFAWLVACSSDEATPSSTASSTASSGGSAGSGGAAGSSGQGGSTGSGGAGGAGAPDSGSDGSEDAGPSDAACGGPVPTTTVDQHCATPDGGRGDDVRPHEGTEADDDNCLYHATITVPCIQLNRDVTLTLDLKDIGTTTPATGAAPEVEAVIGNHPSPTPYPMSSETNGVYTLGPVRFDRTGRWTLTFHIYDAVPAKHSHFSFYVDVL
jgi:hypothetical protein